MIIDNFFNIHVHVTQYLVLSYVIEKKSINLKKTQLKTPKIEVDRGFIDYMGIGHSWVKNEPAVQ